MKNGMVYFVGAGPGDPELLTIKGRRALRTADVIIFDRLVNPILLTEVRDGAKLVYCGKQPCQHFLRQEDIQKELLIHARKGKKVVRLKGGDPAVFGRVGEEAELLSENHINYEIIPGITSGIAAPLYAGATVTHREHSRSFAIVSGHGKDGKPEADWNSLAKGVDTVVFYMGVKYLKLISEQLTLAGKDKRTSVLVIQWGTYSKQRIVEGTLSTIANQVKQEGITNPAIIVVGDVVKLRKKLQWYDNRKLSGKGILFPTKDQANKALVEKLKREGADVYVNPTLTEHSLIHTEAFERALKHIKAYKHIVFLSSESVKEFIKGLIHYHLDLRDINASFYAINQAVKEALLSFGCLSISAPKKQTLDNALIVGGMGDVEDLYNLISSSKNLLITHEQKISDNKVEAFQRLVAENHVNTLLVTNQKEALTFIKVAMKCEMDSRAVSSKLKVICRGKETAFILKAHGIVTHAQLDASATDEQIIKALLEELSLAVES
ncbi:uroporphyrinogen-III C-methyltransferase [Halalkalibacter urbisdiaboli]|uniref:uroporphyrinogen-III C-methyltransferase n=1 Tax=Halalkalibacter urbisdiaboli TaxID=1960589 RepID=UPI000B43C189|nr:uroporphyrinogen-III C-methyltransferase [Halalkalibacter urbisdiaboli]